MAKNKEKFDLVIGAKNKAKGTLNSLKGQIVAVGAAYLGFRAIKGVLTSILKVGMEHEQAWNDVAASLKRHGIAVDSNVEKIKKFSDEMQTLSGVSDEVIGKSVQIFVDYGSSVSTAMSTVKVAMDLAAGSGMDLKAATDLLAKASVGYTGTLSRYGIILDETLPKEEKFAAALEQINDRFGGAAIARADNYAVRLGLLKESFGDLQEAIFKVISPAFLTIMNRMIDGVKTLQDNVVFLSKGFDSMSGVSGIFGSIADLGRTVWNVIKEIGIAIFDTFMPAIEDIFPATKKGIDEIGESFKSLLEIVKSPKLIIALSLIANAFGAGLSIIVAMGTIAGTVFRGIAEVSGKAGDIIVKNWDSVWRAIKSIWEGGSSAAIDKMLENMAAGMIELTLLNTATVNNIKETFNQATQEMIAQTFEHLKNIAEAAMGLTDSIGDFVGAAADAVATEIPMALDFVEEAFDEMIPVLARTEKEFSWTMKRTGKIINILADGIESGLGQAFSNTISNMRILRTETQNILGQIGQFFLRLTLETIATLAIEAIKVAILTKRYIALAAAKSAVNIFSAPARVAAASATLAGLSALALLPGFDDPVNDASAFRHGVDYAGNFLAGQASVFKAPGYGQAITAMQPEQGFVGGGMTININVAGSIISPDDIGEIVEDAVARGRSRITVDSEFISGSTDIGAF